MTRKTALGVAPPIPLWRPTTLTIPIRYEDGESTGNLLHPKARAVEQAWCQLTDEVLDAAKEVGVGRSSWRHCIEELLRITGDDRWMLVARKLDLLERIYESRTKITRKETGIAPFRVSPFMQVTFCKTEYWSLLADSTVTHYQAAVETARAEIRRLTSDFLLSSAPR